MCLNDMFAVNENSKSRRSFRLFSHISQLEDTGLKVFVIKLVILKSVR